MKKQATGAGSMGQRKGIDYLSFCNLHLLMNTTVLICSNLHEKKA
jgi:hypothetical protein